MQVHVGVLLPAEVVVPLVALIEEAAVAPAPEHAVARRGLFRRGRSVPDTPAAGPAHVVPVAAGQVHVPIATFGNLPLGDSIRVGDTLAEAAAGWARPTVRVEGLDPRDQPGTLTVALTGDVEALTRIARGVTAGVEQLGLFVDRRRFHPAAVVGRVDAELEVDASAAVERARAALASYRGEPWTIGHVSLLKVEHDGRRTSFAEIRQLPLGASA